MELGSKKMIIGILGGIGAGKSAVAREFGGLGCAVIDADLIVHELLDRQEVAREIVEEFGNEIISEEGLIDRGKLADIVFSNKKNVSRINEILHPLVFERINELIDEYNEYMGSCEVRAIVLDIPLLMECGRLDLCDKLVFVACNEEIRADRVSKKGLGHDNRLKKREKFQISLDRKAEIAHYIINNNSDLSGLADQVAHLFSTLMQ